MMKRRTALGLMGAALGATATASVAAARKQPAPAALDISDKVRLAEAFRKVAYSLDETLTFWWMRGTRYGVVDSFATTFWDMHVGAWFRTRSLEGAKYEVTIAHVNFYTPPNSGELLQSWRNPYTGKDVPVTYAPPKAVRFELGPDGGSAFGGNIPGMRTTRSDAPGPAWIEGDDVHIQGDMILNAAPIDVNSGAKPLNVNDWSTYIASRRDVADPKIRNAPAAQSFMDVLTWPKWLQMGEQPGSYVSRCYGRKVFRYDAMPTIWRKLFEQTNPSGPTSLVAVLDAAS